LVTVPPSHWKAVEVPIGEHGTTVHCSFDVQTKGAKIQVLLMPRSQAERFSRGRYVSALYLTDFETSARFRYRVPEAGDYVIVLDNRRDSRRAAEVAVRIDLAPPGSVDVRELPPERRRLIVALSLAFFGAVVVFSARQFLKHAA
jgi:hypothetical protein